MEHHSEGTSLTHDDEKCYWGKIRRPAPAVRRDDGEDRAQRDEPKLEIEGSVMIGWGLEPCPIGRFKMMEMEEVFSGEGEEAEEEEGENEEIEKMAADDVAANARRLDRLASNHSPDEGDVDAFEATGAYE